MTQHNTTARATRRAEGQFTTIANAALRDPRLSWKAKGILAGALSHGPGFRFNREWFIRNSTDGDTAIRTGMEELRALGYLVTERETGPNGQFQPGGLHFSDDPTLLQEPKASGGESHGGKTCGGKSTCGFSDPIRRSIERTPKEEHQPEVEPPTPYRGIPPVGGTDVLTDLPQQHEQQPPPFPVGTLAVVPQPAHSAPQGHNAPSPPPSRLKHPAPANPTQEQPEAPPWPSQAPLVAIAPTPAKAPPKPRDPFASKALSADLVPDDLLDCQQLLPEWWSVKAKGRTQIAFNRACSLLRRFTADERRQILETAIIGGHQGLYEPKASHSGSTRQPFAPKQSATSHAFAVASALIKQAEGRA